MAWMFWVHFRERGSEGGGKGEMEGGGRERCDLREVREREEMAWKLQVQQRQTIPSGLQDNQQTMLQLWYICMSHHACEHTSSRQIMSRVYVCLHRAEGGNTHHHIPPGYMNKSLLSSVHPTS